LALVTAKCGVIVQCSVPSIFLTKFYKKCARQTSVAVTDWDGSQMLRGWMGTETMSDGDGYRGVYPRGV